MKNTALLFVHNDSKTPYVLTRELWFGFGYKSHRLLKRVIQSHEKEFLERGILASVDADIQGRGQPEKSYLLNERQFRLLCLLVKNTPNSIKIKCAIEDEFDRIEKELQKVQKMRLTADWQEARANSKCIRKTLGTAIDRLVSVGADYHDIFQECKKRVITTVNGLSSCKLESQHPQYKTCLGENPMNPLCRPRHALPRACRSLLLRTGRRGRLPNPVCVVPLLTPGLWPGFFAVRHG
ncbi:MAG: hypothetical protein ABL933_15750 [Methyloglobulus sp.]